MTQRHCDACGEWHDLAEPWPEECADHYVKVKAKVGDPDKRSTLFEDKMVERGHWKDDRITKESIPIDEWNRRYGGPQTHSILKDMDPYKNVYGEVIGGRKQHRDFLKARGVVEVGNEKIEKQYEEAPGVSEDIRRAMHETGYRREY